MRQLIKEYFSFTKKERVAVVTLVLLIVSVYLLPRFIKSGHHPPTVEEIQELGAPVVHLPPAPDANPNNNKPRGRLFYFDPNAISENEWRQLGLREKTIGTIRNFLSKGGHFYKAEDLKKIYGLKEEEFSRIVSYVKISGPVKEQPRKEHKAILYERDAGKYPANKEFKAAKARVVDINTADIDAFIALPGIGNTLAGRIINFREKLGGFYAVEQVGETYGLQDSTFQKIRPLLSLENIAVKKVNINVEDVETLKSHPYIRWQAANAIIRYREEHGEFKSLEQLQQIGAITQEAYKRMLPYLSIETRY